MVNKELLEQIDRAAYLNKPPLSYINRNDKTVYRMYYSFMRMLYSLYQANALDKEQLAKEKVKFLKDMEILEVLFESALKTIREQQGTQPRGSITSEGVDDVEITRLSGEIGER